MCSIHQAISECAPVVDVDGSYLHRKHQHFTASMTGWESVTEENVHSLVQNIHKVTTGEAAFFVLKLLDKLLYNFFTTFNTGMVYIVYLCHK